jgi:hypothetical protein
MPVSEIEVFDRVKITVVIDTKEKAEEILCWLNSYPLERTCICDYRGFNNFVSNFHNWRMFSDNRKVGFTFFSPSDAVNFKLTFG